MWQRLRISLVFVAFEGGMPLIGLGLGSALARGIGQVANCAVADLDHFLVQRRDRASGVIHEYCLVA